jgi:hypothetical protein
MSENSIAFNSFRVVIFSKLLHSSMLIIVVHGPKKIHASICKIKARGLEFDYPPTKIKN